MAVYPRWRGEHAYWQRMKYRFYGLSPLARGTRADHVVEHIRWRFIPAGAGNTGSEYVSQ